jgi:hypothetical protein
MLTHITTLNLAVTFDSDGALLMKEIKGVDEMDIST